MKTTFLCLALALIFLGPRQGQALPANEPITKPEEIKKPQAKTPWQPSLSAPVTAQRLKFPLIVDFRYGLPLETQNPDVRSQWEHELWSSYLTAAGIYWESPRIFGGDWWLYVGPEFIYQHSHESLSSGNGAAGLDTESYGFQLMSGLSWQPQFLGGDIGFQVGIGLPIWAQQSASIDADGYKKDLGERAVQPIGVALNVFYEIGKQWRPFIGYENHFAPHIDLGLNYAF